MGVGKIFGGEESGPFPALFNQLPAKIRVVPELLDGLADLLGRIRRKISHRVASDFRQGGGVGGKYGATGRHGLHQGKAETFKQGGEDQSPGSEIQIGHFFRGQIADGATLRRKAEFVNPLLEGVPVRQLSPGKDQRHFQVSFLFKPGQGPQQGVVVLVRPVVGRIE